MFKKEPYQGAASIGVIGGSDGPTAVYIHCPKPAGKLRCFLMSRIFETVKLLASEKMRRFLGKTVLVSASLMAAVHLVNMSRREK